MGYPRKIATCCYCGTRAALVLRGRETHELACSRCGAPLHDLKKLPIDREGDRELVERRRPAPAARTPYANAEYLPSKPRKKPKKRRRLVKKIFEEAFDILEDIFD